ncbi:MAG: DUF1538 domain-containing protein [Firmicutes bacterium]|jgi:hypothetical protein|nr:DUF1538 domain-containing protein [Bacillota bacterium]
MNEIQIFAGLGQTGIEVLQALLPLVIILMITPRFVELPPGFITNTVKGLVFTFIGLTMLLHGINVGFFPVSQMMGEIIGASDHRWIAIPIGAVLGFVAAIAEPSLQVQAQQVEEASSGAIKQKILLYTVAIGVAVIVALGMARIIYGLPFLYLIIPGYTLLIVLLKFTEPTFSAIAFDSGACVTGPMVVTFILSLGMGLATTMENRDPITDGFGIVALIAFAPILAVMLLGQIYKDKD